MNLLDQLKNDLKPEFFTPISRIKKETPLHDAHVVALKAWKQGLQDDLTRSLNLLPLNQFDELIHSLRTNPIEIKNDSSVVVYIDGISIQSIGHVFELLYSDKMIRVADITYRSQLVILNHLEKLL